MLEFGEDKEFMNDNEDFLSSDYLKKYLDKLLHHIGCFHDIFLLYEDFPDDSVYRVMIGPDFAMKEHQVKYKIPRNIFSELDNFEGPLLISSRSLCPLNNFLSYNLVPYKIQTGYILYIKLRPGNRIIILLTNSVHQCEHVPFIADCCQRSPARIKFLKQVTYRLSRHFNLINNVKQIIREESRNDAFLTMIAHGISLPLTSIIIDSANILRKTSKKDPNFDKYKHIFDTAQFLNMKVENYLHEPDNTDQPKAEFCESSLFGVIGEACDMFMGEATDKGCDIKTSIIFNNNEIPLISAHLGDKKYIYYTILYKNLKDARKYPETDEYNENIDIKSFILFDKNTISEESVDLPKRCHELLHSEGVKHKDMDIHIYINNKIKKISTTEADNVYHPDIEMVRDDLSLAFKNLIHNAVKYSYRSSERGNKRYVQVNIQLLDMRYYKCTISNYGIGIREHEINQGLIWKQRYRGRLSRDRSRHGSGLGLSHVKWAIETVHGGTINVRSDLKEGGAYRTVFTLILPISQKFRVENKTQKEQDNKFGEFHE